MNCPKCGAPNYDSARFCATCGESLSQPVEPPASPQPEQPIATSSPATSTPPPQPLPYVAPPAPQGRAIRREGAPKGFFGSLFDLSFENFVATKLVKVLFVIGLIVAVLYGLGVAGALLVAGFGASQARGGPGAIALVGGIIGAIILGPLVFFLMALGARIWSEMLIVVFRIAEHTAEIARQGREQ